MKGLAQMLHIFMGCDDRRTAHVGFVGSFHCWAMCQLAESSWACSPSTCACPSTVQASSCTAGLLTVSLTHAKETSVVVMVVMFKAILRPGKDGEPTPLH